MVSPVYRIFLETILHDCVLAAYETVIVLGYAPLAARRIPE
jgi:hypothetical protein